MTFQIIDGETFVNGVSMEVDKIPQEQIEESLATLTIQINNKKNTLDKLLDQRDEVIVHAFNNGFSAIRLGKLLNLTRQRIYEVVKGKQPKKKFTAKQRNQAIQQAIEQTVEEMNAEEEKFLELQEQKLKNKIKQEEE
tara:strand:- start:6535 stop:6948 length:414 start_codon:yes stop_codon:yes gene_type:complete